jgi:hypothetical protein
MGWLTILLSPVGQDQGSRARSMEMVADSFNSGRGSRSIFVHDFQAHQSPILSGDFPLGCLLGRHGICHARCASSSDCVGHLCRRLRWGHSHDENTYATIWGCRQTYRPGHWVRHKIKGNDVSGGSSRLTLCQLDGIDDSCRQCHCFGDLQLDPPE